MDLKELRTQYPQYDDLSDQEFADGFYEKYYSDMPKTEFYSQIGLAGTSTQGATASSPSSPGASANTLAQRAAPWVRTGAEILGAIGGGLAGAPGGPLVSAAGGATGYAGGRQLANAYERAVGLRPDINLSAVEGTTKALAEIGKDTGAGALLEAAGGALGGAAGYVGKKLAPYFKRAPEKIYASALKPSTTMEPVKRQAMIQEGLISRIPVTREGLQKTQNLIDDLSDNITKIVQGSPKSIDMRGVVNRIDDAKRVYEGLPPAIAKPYLNELDSIKAAAMSAGEKITPAAAQKMKQSIYRLQRKHYGELKGTTVEGQKQLARGLKEALLAEHPELALLNAKEGALIDLEKSLSRAAARIDNRDILGLPEYLTAGSLGIAGEALGGFQGGLLGVGLALLPKILRSPEVKSKLAFALKKAQKYKVPTKGRAPAARAVGYGSLSAATAPPAVPSMDQEEQRWKSIGDEY